MYNTVSRHYDLLIENENDAFRDAPALKEYMSKWDGRVFFEELCLDKTKTVLEIGVGTGRLAHETAPLCKQLYGIDISEKTIMRAKENLQPHHNIKLIYGDFMSYDFDTKFDVIYSCLTFMHISDKNSAVKKIKSLLNESGIFVLSSDKNQEDVIDAGFSKIKIYPDSPELICRYLSDNGFVYRKTDTEFAHIFIAKIQKQ